MTDTITLGTDADARRPRAIPARRPDWQPRLERKLLAIGGSAVVWPDSDTHAPLIAAGGRTFAGAVRMRPGEPHRCHANAADLWATGIDRYGLVTGYALSRGRWLSHSWVAEGDTLWETTHRFDRYFGVILPPLAAVAFWAQNAYAPNYHGVELPPAFWAARPGVLDLMRRFVETRGYTVSRERSPGDGRPVRRPHAVRRRGPKTGPRE
jgi:hypothetical protein